MHVFFGNFSLFAEGMECFKFCDKNVSQKHFYKYCNHATDDCSLMALSALLDSEATFAQQAEECGLSEPWITALKDNGVATFAMLSFAITSPGTVASDQVTCLLNNMRPGVVATIADFVVVKRVLFESQTLLIHRFKSAAEGDDTVPKKMSAPEHDARLTRQRDQLRGSDITGSLEPAHELYDLCARWLNVMRWLTSALPSVCQGSRN